MTRYQRLETWPLWRLEVDQEEMQLLAADAEKDQEEMQLLTAGAEKDGVKKSCLEEMR